MDKSSVGNSGVGKVEFRKPSESVDVGQSGVGHPATRAGVPELLDPGATPNQNEFVVREITGEHNLDDGMEVIDSDPGSWLRAATHVGISRHILVTNRPPDRDDTVGVTMTMVEDISARLFDGGRGLALDSCRAGAQSNRIRRQGAGQIIGARTLAVGGCRDDFDDGFISICGRQERTVIFTNSLSLTRSPIHPAKKLSENVFNALGSRVTRLVRSAADCRRFKNHPSAAVHARPEIDHPILATGLSPCTEE